MAPMRSYIICTSPRSGSTLLCTLLRATRVAGHPESYFHKTSLVDWLRGNGLTDDFATHDTALRAVIERAMDTGSGGTDIFGLRLQRHSFDFFMEQLHRITPGCQRDLERINAVFGPTLFIHLRRADKLAQAISRIIAQQSGLWHRHADGSEMERLSPPRAPLYDRDAIAREIERLSQMDHAWDDWFVREEITPLRVEYDALASNPQAQTARILSALGLDPAPAAVLHPPTAKLADAVNADWAARFEAEA